MIIIIYIIRLIKKIHHEKKQKLSKEAQEIAELYTRLEILKSKQIEGVKTTRYTTDTIRACQGRIRKLLQKVGGIEEIQIKVDDARTLAEYFSGIRYLPEFGKKHGKGSRAIQGHAGHLQLQRRGQDVGHLLLFKREERTDKQLIYSK